MSTALPRTLLRLRYADAAQEYLRSLTMENFMEATSQATQRKITLESMDLVHVQRPDIQCFNELLVQYPRLGGKKIGQIVPDNFLVVHPEPIDADGSYDVVFQPVPPFCVMEYVSKHNRRKDYESSFQKYEQELKAPYYLLFYPDAQELSLFRLRKGRYESVKPNKHGRYPIKPLELEIAILDGWVRFWFRGELLPLPGDLQRELNQARERLAEVTRRADEADRRADEATRSAEQERLARQAAEQQLAVLQAQLEQLRKGR